MIVGARTAIAATCVFVIGMASFVLSVRAGDAAHRTVKVASLVSLWIGDSYTAGAGASNPANGEACLTAALMQWSCELDAEPGSGYVVKGHWLGHIYRPLVDRLPADRRVDHPSVVILDAGRNDEFVPLPIVERAVQRELRGLHAAWPRATLIVIAPYFMNRDTEPLGGSFVMFLRAEANKYRGHLIDPVREGWMGSAATSAMTIADRVHPDVQGHRYIAAHLADDLRRDHVD